MPRDPSDPSPEDLRFAELLDEFTDAVEREDATRRDDLLSAHPELAEWLGCLSGLAGLARQVAPHPDEADGVPTVLYAGQTPPVDATTDYATDAANGSTTSQTVGDYELIEEIGRGGMGVVYRARQRGLDRHVALKMIRGARFASADEVARFRRETLAMARLRHPHVVAVHEAGDCDGQPFFTMDLIDGESLAKRLQHDKISIDDAAACIATLARAVQYLHDAAIIHRDLKPGNVLVDADGCPYLTDFGLARLGHDSTSTQSGTILGSPEYMSPEQAAGRTNEIGTGSDIYSLGVMLYEMLTGRPPFRNENPWDTLIQAVESEPVRPRQIDKSIPRELESICLACLSKHPDDRYASAAELADDLERFLRDEAISLPEPGIILRVSRWARRVPELAGRWTALFGIAVVLEGNFWWHHQTYDFAYNLRMLGLLALWAVLAYLFQRLVRRRPEQDAPRTAWITADILMLTIMLLQADGSTGPLLIGYPLLIVAAGLFGNVRSVRVATIASFLSFLALSLIRAEYRQFPHYAVMFAASLAVTAWMITHLVRRTETLSRFCDLTRSQTTSKRG